MGVPPDVPLTIVAPRPDSAVRDELAALAAGKSVRFAFDLPDADLVREYRRACCVVLPSVYRSAAGETRVPELLGQTLLEGMACEAPAVCTSVASMPEVVEDRVTGFVVPPNDPVTLGERVEWLFRHRTEAADAGPCGAAPGAVAVHVAAGGRSVPRRLPRRCRRCPSVSVPVSP